MSNPQNLPARRLPTLGPTVLSSAGVFILVFWLLSILPGRATKNYLESGGPRTLAAAQSQQNAPETPRVLPSQMALVITRGRFYHWNLKCPLLHSTSERRHQAAHRITRAEAEFHNFKPCYFCIRHEWDEK